MTASSVDDPTPPVSRPGGSSPEPASGQGLSAVPGCPFLAGGDGSWSSVHATRSHVCAAVEPAAQLTASKQRQLCLTAAHETCATFVAGSALLAHADADGGDAGLWPASRSRVVTLEPVRTGLAGITSPQARTGGQAMLVGLMVVAFLLLVVARTTSPATPGGSPAPTTLPGTVAASPSVVGPSGSPLAPTPTPPVAATPSPSAAASASPAGQQTYKVKRGDTLSSIALKFGVTVKALKKANGITGGSVIRRGQVLVIP